MKLTNLSLAALTLALAFSPLAQADVWNKKTTITTNAPLQIPGKVLPAGKYVLRLVESLSNRHIVQVMNETEDKVEATLIAIPNYRLQPTGETRFGFWETPAGTTPALRSWFYPGDNFGQEFAYPKSFAATLTAVNKETVPTLNDDADAAAQRAAARIAANQPVSEPAAAAAVEVAKVEPTPEPVAAPAVVEPTPAPVAATASSNSASSNSGNGATEQSATPAPMATTLPKTGSSLPLAALGGLMLLVSGLGLNLISRR